MLEKDKQQNIGCVDLFCRFVGAIVLTLLQAYFFLFLWRWFIVPLGVTDIVYAHALGLCVLSSFMTVNATSANKTMSTKEFWTASFAVIIADVIIMLIGLIAHMCM